MHKLLKAVMDCDASDLHITSGAPPIVRVDGNLKPLNFPRLLLKIVLKWYIVC